MHEEKLLLSAFQRRARVWRVSTWVIKWCVPLFYRCAHVCCWYCYGLGITQETCSRTRAFMLYALCSVLSAFFSNTLAQTRVGVKHQHIQKQRESDKLRHTHRYRHRHKQPAERVKVRETVRTNRQLFQFVHYHTHAHTHICLNTKYKKVKLQQ